MDRIDMIDIHKMIFIYNALQEGWIIKKINNDKYEFKKAKDDLTEEVYLDQYIRKFLMYNMSIENLFKKDNNGDDK